MVKTGLSLGSSVPNVGHDSGAEEVDGRRTPDVLSSRESRGELMAVTQCTTLGGGATGAVREWQA